MQTVKQSEAVAETTTSATARPTARSHAFSNTDRLAIAVAEVGVSDTAYSYRDCGHFATSQIIT